MSLSHRSRSHVLRAAAVLLLYFLYRRRDAIVSTPAATRRPLRRYSYVARGARPLVQSSPVDEAPLLDAVSHAASEAQLRTPSTPSVDGVTAASARRRCALCGSLKTHGGAIDVNCCSRGGSWAGQCGPPGSGAAYTWKEGFRACNNVSVAPAPRRAQHGAFLPLVPLVSPSPHVSPTDEAAGRAAHGSGALNGAIGAVASNALPSAMRAYLLTLGALSVAEERLHRMLASAVGSGGGVAIRGSALAGVRRSDALAVAGVAPEQAVATFGEQASHPEFLSALGCVLSHLRAAHRALTDGASPALILEEDAVSDLHPLWPMDLSAMVGDAAGAMGGGAARDACRPE